MPDDASKTIAEFVEEISKTEIPGAKKWLEEFKEAYPGWYAYASCSITPESLNFILLGISARVTFQIRHMKDFADILKRARSFVDEVAQKAKAIGVVPNEPTAMDAIIVPRSFVVPVVPPGKRIWVRE